MTKRRFVVSASEHEQAIKDGRLARYKGDPISSNPYGAISLHLSSAWSAGWHDMDMELKA